MQTKLPVNLYIRYRWKNIQSGSTRQDKIQWVHFENSRYILFDVISYRFICIYIYKYMDILFSLDTFFCGSSIILPTTFRHVGSWFWLLALATMVRVVAWSRRRSLVSCWGLHICSLQLLMSVFPCDWTRFLLRTCTSCTKKQRIEGAPMSSPLVHVLASLLMEDPKFLTMEFRMLETHHLAEVWRC